MAGVKEKRIREQIRIHVARWKKQIRDTASQQSRDYLVTMWMGYLNGLRMAGIIGHGAYTELYGEMQHYAEGLEAGRKKETGQPVEGTAGSPEHRKHLIPGL